MTNAYRWAFHRTLKDPPEAAFREYIRVSCVADVRTALTAYGKVIVKEADRLATEAGGDE